MEVFVGEAVIAHEQELSCWMLGVYDGNVTSGAFIPSSPYIVSCCDGGTLNLWDRTNWKLGGITLARNEKSFYLLAVNKNSLAVASSNQLELFDLDQHLIMRDSKRAIV